MRRLVLLSLLGVGLSAAACAGPATYTVSASLASPDLVYVGPGVYAVANADAPVFYADNYYWLYADGFWYRSSYATGGWRYAPAPYVIRQIDRPLAYQRARTYRRDRQVHVEMIEPAHRVYRDRPAPRTQVREREVPAPAPRTQVRERPAREREREHRTEVRDRE